MVSRALGVVFASWLPCLALMLPLSPFHTVNALVAGIAAAALAALSLSHDWARLGASIIGGWVAFVPFVFPSTLTEIVLCVCWGVTMFVSLGGPFSQEPRRTFGGVPRPARGSETPQGLPIAA